MGIDARGRRPKTSGVKIHLNRAGQSLGTFTPAEVRAGYDSGKFLPGDLAWQDGMDSWKPLGEVVAELAPASADASIAPVNPSAPALPSEGVPWERRKELGFFTGLFETIRGVMLEPGRTFRGMNPAGGLGAPLFFFVIMGTVTGSVAVLYQTVFTSLQGGGEEGAVAALAVSSVTVGLTIMLLPIFLVLGAFVSSALMHLGLMILGGARRPFEATFRVACYAGGSTSVLQLLPGCGGLIATIWNLVALIIGIAEVHGISKGKAAVAILLPSLVCCGLVIAMVIAVAASLGGVGEFMQQVAQEAGK